MSSEISAKSYLALMPVEIIGEVSQYLSIREFLRCTQVSKEWYTIFSSDFIWGLFAKKYKIDKQETKSISKFLLGIAKIYFPLEIFANRHFAKNFKNSTRDIFKADKWPKPFLKLFGSKKAISNLPLVVLEEGETLKTEHFSAPVVRFILKRKNNVISYLMLFRGKNNETGVKFTEEIGFVKIFDKLHFLKSFDREESGRVICKKYTNLISERFDRLQRLIRHEPVGLIMEDKRYSIVEGPTMTADGKSVLELC